MESPFQWMWDFEAQAQLDGDAQRLQLVTLCNAAFDVGHDFPDEKLALFEAGRNLAHQLGEPWWEMYFEGWVIEVLLFQKRQPDLALDHAMRALVETSKPHFATFPQRLDLQMNLISIYTEIDPIGYESELRDLLEYVRDDCHATRSNRAYHAQLLGKFLIGAEVPLAVEVAFACIRLAQQAGDDADNYIGNSLEIVCTALCHFDRDGARQQLGEFATLGEEMARGKQRSRSIAFFLMWRALAARWDGNEAEAKRFYRRAFVVQSKLPPPQNEVLYAAMVYHEEGGEWERALQICQADIRILRAHKLTFLEAQRRVDKCRISKQMGRDFSRDAKRLRRVAAKLKSRAHWEMRLAALETGSGN